MTIYYQDDYVALYHGDCLDVMAAMPDSSVDSIVTDPPYGLSNTKPAQVADVLKAWVTGDTEAVPAKRGGFMGKDWDSFVPPPAVWEECMRVLKPGGHMAVFAGARTQDLMGLSIRLAGFELRDSLAWLYGSGFPKSHDVSKAIDKLAGAKREVIGAVKQHTGAGSTMRRSTQVQHGYRPEGNEYGGMASDTIPITAPATSEAAKWDGWGTALKPAFEPIVLARKPLDGTLAANVLEHGTGAINIDACRVGTEGGSRIPGGMNSVNAGNASHGYRTSAYQTDPPEPPAPSGRWPANVLLDQHAAAWVDEQSGIRPGFSGGGVRRKRGDGIGFGHLHADGEHSPRYGDNGGASRFFYTAKASKKERPNVDGVQHPTVKPLKIMRWLIRLVTPPGGTVLDPFAGSGTTIEAAMIEGFRPVGIEKETDYLPLITARITRAKTSAQGVLDLGGIA